MLPGSTFWSARRVCVVGGTGFLGWHLAQQLVERGASVRVFGLRPRSDHPLLQSAHIDARFGDVRVLAQVRDAVADCSIIFNAAGVVSATANKRSQFHDVHLSAIRNIVETAPAQARIVHTSSVVTIGATHGEATLSEDSPASGACARIDYVCAKREAERIALDAAAAGRDVVATNPGFLVGPGDFSHSVMGRVCLRFWNGRLPLVPPGGLNLVDVRDAAAGHLLAAEHGACGRTYILGGENRTWREFFYLLASAGGASPRLALPLPSWGIVPFAILAEARARLLNKMPFPSLQEARLNRYYWFHRSERAVRELGFRARPARDSLVDSYAWHRQRGLIKPRGLSRWWLRPAA